MRLSRTLSEKTCANRCRWLPQHFSHQSWSRFAIYDQIDELIVIESLRAVASDSVGGLTDDLGPDKPGVLVTLDLPEFMSAAEEEDLRRHLVTVVEQIS